MIDLVRNSRCSTYLKNSVKFVWSSFSDSAIRGICGRSRMLDSAAFCSIWPGMQGEDCKQKVTKNEDLIREHLVSHSEKFCQFCPVPLFLIQLSAVDFLSGGTGAALPSRSFSRGWSRPKIMGRHGGRPSILIHLTRVIPRLT